MVNNLSAVICDDSAGFCAECAESLQKNGINPKNILVKTDRTEDGSISIGQVTVTVDTAAQALAAKKIIKDGLGIDIICE